MIDFWKQKYSGYRRLIEHKLEMRQHQRFHAACRQRYDTWISRLTQNPPDVFIGGNLSHGGIRNHLQAIAKHSKLNIELTPNEKAFSEFKYFHANLRAELIQWVPDCQAIHSHVFPWAMEWGQNAQKNGVRWIHTYHLNYFPEHGKTGIEPWQQEINDALLNLAPKADIRLSVAQWQRDEFLEKHGIESYYLPNGVDVANCDQGRAEKFIKKTGHKNFILYVGRNDPVKNPAAFAQLAEQMPERQFVMIGQDLSAETLQREFNQGTTPNLYIHGSEDHRGVQDAIAASAAVVVTSKREGLPTLVLEAMTHGKPIIVPDEPGCREAISDGRYGFIYEPDNLADLVKKTREALQDTDRCSQARERVLAEFDWQLVAQKLDFIYTEPDLAKVNAQLEQWQTK